MAGKKKVEKEKPLEKMTAKELREVAKDIDGIVGVHGMNKDELVSEIKKVRGIAETAKAVKADMRGVKKKIRTLKAEREKALSADDKKMAAIYRRRISRLKKQTRRAA
ncbi:MAG: Rho termination factor N-terminal domain-containing protein [Pseudomonadota bacterium]